MDTITLDENDTTLWDDDGPDGDAYRAQMRDDHGGESVEIRSYDGITLDAWTGA